MGQLDEIQKQWTEKLLAILSSPASKPATQPQGPLPSNTAAGAAGALPKIPTGTELGKWLEANAKEEPPAPAGESSPALQFAPSKSAVGEKEDGRLSPDLPHDSLPSALKSKLSKRLWSDLEHRQRQNIVTIYRRLKEYGVWDQVKRVTGEIEKPSAPVKIGPWEFEVAGNSGGISFEAYDGNEMIKKLKATGHFGEDSNATNFFHPGQRGLREWSDDPTSLHSSFGPGDQFDAHIDKVSPTNEPVHGQTRIDLARGVEHFVNEPLVEMIRDKTGIPLILEGSVVENREEGWHGVEFRGGAKVELRWPAATEKKRLGPNQTGPDPPAADVLERILKRAEGAKNDFPLPIGMNPDEAPSRAELARHLAAEILEAGRNGKTEIQLSVPQYLNKTDDQPAALAAIREVGHIVQSELGPQAEKVHRIKVIFGPKQLHDVSF